MFCPDGDSFGWNVDEEKGFWGYTSRCCPGLLSIPGPFFLPRKCPAYEEPGSPFAEDDREDQRVVQKQRNFGWMVYDGVVGMNSESSVTYVSWSRSTNNVSKPWRMKSRPQHSKSRTKLISSVSSDQFGINLEGTTSPTKKQGQPASEG